MTKRRINKEIKAELQRILQRARDGRLHWEDVVKAARSPSSPLHSYFDWNRERAMEAYLRGQAEELIASYTVVIETRGGKTTRTRAFVSLTTDRQSGGGYRAIHEVLSDAALRAQLMRDALADLQAFKTRYAKLRGLGELFRAIRKVSRQVMAKQQRRPEHRAGA